MREAILEKISLAQQKKRPRFSVGDRISVSVRLKEGDKERIQIFQGVVIRKTPKSGVGVSATFTVRKISSGVGVERIFPLHSPVIEKIQVESSSEVRRSRLFYLRQLSGKKARLKEAAGFEDLFTEEAPEIVPEIAPHALPETAASGEKNTSEGTAKPKEGKET